ncbi:hypothetical protein [Micromonospora sp. NPDC005203]|uniref:hypothetical protein n=1 Tax=Micromonospora sp. NPDC005203 TaxID=3364226 RepID=UPI00369762DD
MKLRAAILSVLTALGLSLVVVALPAEPARACSCVRPAEADERADLIVVGTITEVMDNGVQLAVASVEKGSLPAGATLRLRVGRSESSCGYNFRVGTRYRVNSTGGATGLCSGVRTAPAPAQSQITPSASVAAPTPVTAAPTLDQSSGRWFATGATLTILAAGVVVAVLRRRRTRANIHRGTGPAAGP